LSTWYDRNNNPVEVADGAALGPIYDGGLRPVPDAGTPDGWFDPFRQHAPDYYAPATRYNGATDEIVPTRSGS
jgi:hypothetical protein